MIAIEQVFVQPGLHVRVSEQLCWWPAEEVGLEELEILPAEELELRVHGGSSVMYLKLFAHDNKKDDRCSMIFAI